MAIDTHSLLLPKCVHLVQRTRRCDQIAVLLQRTAASLCDDGLMAPKMLRLRSSSQMREVNTHGTAAGGVWLRPSVCVRAIGSRYRRGRNRQGSEVDNLARVTPGYARDADRQTNLHLPK